MQTEKALISKIDNYILIYFYPIMMVSFLLLMFKIDLYILWPLRLFILYYGTKVAIKYRTSLPFRLLISGFILYNILSGIAYISNDIPLICYNIDFVNYIIPILFIFIGMDPSKTDFKFNNSFLWSSIFCFSLGILLLIIGPSWYLNFLAENRNSLWYISNPVYNEDNIFNYARFSSFMGSSYAISHFGMFSIAILLSLLYKYNSRKKLNEIILYGSLVISYVAVLLCQQRIAIIFSTIIILFYFLIGLNGNFRFSNRIIIIVFVFIIFILLFPITNNNIQVLSEQISTRIESISIENMIQGSRAKQYNQTLNRWSSYLFGHGLGTFGSMARFYKNLGVSDGNYLKILVENGILGIMWFSLIIVLTIIRSLRNIKYLSLEIGIVFSILFAMIGSNSLVINFFYIPPFWYSIGRIWNNNYLSILKSS